MQKVRSENKNLNDIGIKYLKKMQRTIKNGLND